MAESIATLKNRIATLKAANTLHTEDSDNLRSKVTVAYVKKVLAELEGILNWQTEINEDVINQLSIFFNRNWELIKNTALCYTALPAHNLTQLLGEFAQVVVDFKNQHMENNVKPLSIVNVLMPTVVTDSYNDDFQGVLGPKEVLDTGFDEEGNPKPQKGRPSFVWVNTPVNITQVLQTHVLSDDGFSLLPVRLLTRLETGAESQQVDNPYYDYQNGAMNPYLNEDELIRLGQHSSSTTAVFDAKKQYELCLNDQSNLLGHLRQLCLQLTYNSAHGGIGSETNAAMGAYGAIIAFNEYYESLDIDSKEKIPLSVKEEIDLLLGLSSDATRNTDSTANMQTCIGTRAEKLAKVIKINESTLSTIGVGGTKKQALLEKARSEFNAAKLALQQELDEHRYTQGKDKLGINRRLLQVLNVKVLISCDDDLKNFQTLAPAEITDIMQVEGVKEQFVRQLKPLEKLVCFLHETSSDRLKAIFSAVGSSVFQPMITTRQDLTALLMTLNTEHCEIILESMSEGVTRLIRTAPNFAAVVENLGAEQQTAIIRFMSNRLPKLVQPFNNLSTVLESLHSEPRLLVLKQLQSKLPVINSNEKMIKTFSYYPFEHFHEILSLIKPKLKYNATAVESIKADIQTSNDTDIIKRIGKLSIKDLMVLSIEMPPERLKQVLNKLAEDLCPKLVKSPEKLSAWLSTMNKECRDIVGNVLKEKYCTPKSTKWFPGVFQHLKSDQQKDLLAVVKDKLPELIRTHADMNSLFNLVNPEEYKTIYEALQPQFSTLVPSIKELRSVFFGLDENKQSAFFKAIQGELPRLINSISDLDALFASEIDLLRTFMLIGDHPVAGMLRFLLLFTYFPQRFILFPSVVVGLSQRLFITKAIVEKLPTLIQTPSDLLKVLTLVDKREGGHAFVLETVKDKLANFIMESTDAHFRDIIFASLTPKLRQELYAQVIGQSVCTEITNDLFEKIKSARVKMTASDYLGQDALVKQTAADKQKALKPLMMRFELALAQQNFENLRTAFSDLYRAANTHRSKIGFFQKGTTHSSEKLLDCVSKIRDKQHLQTLNEALGLNLTADKLKSPSVIRKALKTYLNTGHGAATSVLSDEHTHR